MTPQTEGNAPLKRFITFPRRRRRTVRGGGGRRRRRRGERQQQQEQPRGRWRRRHLSPCRLHRRRSRQKCRQSIRDRITRSGPEDEQAVPGGYVEPGNYLSFLNGEKLTSLANFYASIRRWHGGEERRREEGMSYSSSRSLFPQFFCATS